MTKVGRNDPCPCGSGKKFKKCCEEKTSTKKFEAKILSSSQGNTSPGAEKVRSLFSRKVEVVSPPKHTPPPEDAPTDNPSPP